MKTKYADCTYSAFISYAHADDRSNFSWISHFRKELQSKLSEQKTANEAARLRNEQLDAEVRDLKEGLEMVEEKARSELGMLKPNEILVQLAPQR